MKLSKARIKRASVRGKILMLRFWGSEYGKAVRLKRRGRLMSCVNWWYGRSEEWSTEYYRITKSHPRRALIITKSGITPVRLKGK